MARKMKRYDEGGVTEPEESKTYKAEPAQEGTGLKKESFKEAFARARRYGDSTFEWNGKSYSTALKGEKKKDAVADQSPMEFRDISQSPRISDMQKTRDLANKRSNDAEERKSIVYKQEQARLSDLSKQGVVPEKELKTSRERLGAVNKTADASVHEFMKRDMPLRRDAEARGKGDKYDAMKKGGAVKKYAKGGSVSSASKRGDGIAQRGKTKGRVL